MAEPLPEPPAVDTTDHSQRDATSLKMLGFFFTTLGLLVLVGTLWSLDDARAIVVNIASGTLLVAIGGGMVFLARRTRAN